jgi:hemolysin activation/secretion protein
MERAAPRDLDLLVHRDQTSRTSLRAGLKAEDVANYLNDVLIGVSSRTVSIGSIELSHTNTLLGGPVQTRFGVHRGLPLFGAADNGGPFAIFTKIDGDISHTLPLFERATLSTSLSGQWSADQLYSSEQLSLTGIPGFSGFAHPGMSGETGLKARAELAYALPPTGSAIDGLLGRVTAFAALESGWTFPGPSNGDLTANFGGATAGLRLTQGVVSGAVSWAVPLWGPGNFDRSGTLRVEAGITLSQF